MADASDVENALATLVTTALYPLGTANGSITGQVYRIYRGFPGDNALEADLALAIVHMTVSMSSGTKSDIEQISSTWMVAKPTTPTLSVTIIGSEVTFAGQAGLGQIAGVLVDDAAFSYRTQPGDTAASVAASLCSLINQVFFATVAGAAITVLGATRLIARVEADQSAVLPTRRQSQEFCISCWASTPLARDQACSAIDLFMSQQYFITMADSTAGRLRYIRAETTDIYSPAELYRRDLTYSVEYFTTLIQTQPIMIFGITANDSIGTVNLS